jgi:hypothetical protein
MIHVSVDAETFQVYSFGANGHGNHLFSILLSSPRPRVAALKLGQSNRQSSPDAILFHFLLLHGRPTGICHHGRQHAHPRSGGEFSRAQAGQTDCVWLQHHLADTWFAAPSAIPCPYSCARVPFALLLTSPSSPLVLPSREWRMLRMVPPLLSAEELFIFSKYVISDLYDSNQMGTRGQLPGMSPSTTSRRIPQLEGKEATHVSCSASDRYSSVVFDSGQCLASRLVHATPQ